MSKKHYIRPVKVIGKAGEELKFPDTRHVLTSAQRELPNPAAALAAMAQTQPQPTIREDLHAERRRPLDAPMATRIGDLPDPIAAMAWDAVVADAHQEVRQRWEKWSFAAALAIWSAACFLLGTLA